MPRQQEDRLELRDDRALEAEHEVVRPREVVVLDPGPTDVADAPIDDDDLPVIEMAQVVEAPVDVPLAEQTIQVEEGALVRDHLDATGDQRRIELLRAEPRLAERRLGDDADADARRGLRHQHVPESIADLARLEAEDEDMDVAGRGFDVLEHPREELRAIDEQVHTRRRRRLEVEGEVTAFPAAAHGSFDDGLGPIRGDDRGGSPTPRPLNRRNTTPMAVRIVPTIRRRRKISIMAPRRAADP